MNRSEFTRAAGSPFFPAFFSPTERIDVSAIPPRVLRQVGNDGACAVARRLVYAARPKDLIDPLINALVRRHEQLRLLQKLALVQCSVGLRSGARAFIAQHEFMLRGFLKPNTGIKS